MNRIRPTAFVFYSVGLLLALVLLYVRLGSRRYLHLGDLVQQRWLHSAGVFHDLFVDRFPVSGLSFPTAPCIFPDIILSQPFFAIAPNAIVGTLAYGMLQFCFLAGAFGFCARAIGSSEPRLVTAGLFASATLITLVSASKLSIQALMLFLPTFHTGSLVMTAATLGMVLMWLRRNAEGRSSNRALAIVFSIVVFLARSVICSTWRTSSCRSLSQ